ncbi:MAG: hypothetical protein RPU42_14610 [Candidatus Sedimenticola sp. (ex Thyasira tokunagai)]
MEQKTKRRQRNTGIVLIGLAALGAISAVAIFAFYYSHFGHMEISETPANWGPFGDFIGGVLNPIVGLLALIGLLWTIYQNQVELSLAREEMSRSSEALEKNNEQSEKRSQIDNTLRVIDIIDQQITRLLDNNVQWENEHSPFKSRLLAEGYKLKKCKHNEYLVMQITSALVQLISYSKTYEELTGDDLLPIYYETKTMPVIKHIIAYSESLKKIIKRHLPDAIL